LNLVGGRATNSRASFARETVMAVRQLSGWHIATLILAFCAVIAVAAVALILGKDAVISIAIILVLGVGLVSWLLNG
jgi:hypothetical protein